MTTLITRQALLLAAALACAGALAQETGKVISTTPVIQQTAVAREVCTIEQVSVQQHKSGAGAVLGAIAGGAIGNSIGDGSGRAAATVIGVLGGAILGDRIESAGTTSQQPVRQCQTQHIYEPRTVAYNVVYEFAGKQYSVQLPYDPGSTIKLQITPVGAGSSSLGSSTQVQETILAAPRPLYPAHRPTHVIRSYIAPLPLLGLGPFHPGGHRHHQWH